MKRNLLLGIVLLSLSAGCAHAVVTVQESTDAEYLYNAGYSQAFTEDIFMEKSRALGKPIEPLYNSSVKQNPIVRLGKKFYGYLDPSIEEADKLHHDIKLSPSYSDL